MNKDSLIYVAGHTGLVGSAITWALDAAGYSNLLTRTHEVLDLTDPVAVNSFFETEKPEYVFIAAAKVGGIYANSTYPADFIRINLQIQTNIIHAACKSGVTRLLDLGSSCIYPKHAPQPMKEEHLLSGPLEPTNEAYAIAKIAGIVMCNSYHKQYGLDCISLMPTNLYGPGDNYHPQNSHVLPALLHRFHEAKKNSDDEIVVWGTGTPRREFLYVDDLANAALFVMNQERQILDEIAPDGLLNVGYGSDVTIAELAKMIAEIVGYQGRIIFDKSKPDGTPLKQLDSTRINSLGWKATTPLRKGIEHSYKDAMKTNWKRDDAFSIPCRKV